MPRFVELSHVLEPGMPTYPGLPAPQFGAVIDHESSRERYQHKAEFFLGRVDMPTNLGTYLDTPFHRYKDGADLAAVPLDLIAGLPALVLDAPERAGAVDLALPAGSLAGRAVLVRSGWSRRWGDASYWAPGPFLSSGAVSRLLEARPALVGVDFWNVDDTTDPARPAHTRLLEPGILIVEHLTGLDQLPATGARFWAVPPRVKSGASWTVRAFAQIE